MQGPRLESPSVLGWHDPGVGWRALCWTLQNPRLGGVLLVTSLCGSCGSSGDDCRVRVWADAPREGRVKSAAAMASVDRAGSGWLRCGALGGRLCHRQCTELAAGLKDPHLSAQLPARVPAQSAAKTTPSLYYQNNPHLSLASQHPTTASNLPADKVCVKLPYRPAFTSEPKEGS